MAAGLQSQGARGVGGAMTGIGLLFEGVAILRRNRSLWGLATIPVLLCLAAVSAVAAVVYLYAGDLHAFVTGWLPVIEVTAWYRWLWLGPAMGFLKLFGFLLFALSVGVALVAAFLLSNAIAAPFLDVLSRRVERIERGEIVESGEAGWRAIVAEGRRAILAEAQRGLFFALLWGAIFVTGILIPGGQLVASPLLVVLTILFLPLDYASYVLDRRQVPFRRRRVWIKDRLPLMSGFGAAAFASCLVPGLNFLMLPALVAGGTLLAVRFPPRAGVPG